MVYRTPRTYSSFKQAKFRAASMSRYDGNRFYYVTKVTSKPKRYIVSRGKGYIRKKN